MGRGNSSFEMDMDKDPLMGGDDGEKSFGYEIVTCGENEEEDVAFALFQDWLVGLADGQTIWRGGKSFISRSLPLKRIGP